jgi:hypothetical protein
MEKEMLIFIISEALMAPSLTILDIDNSRVRSEDRMQDPKSEADANNILRL